MKFYTKRGHVATIHCDISTSRRRFNAASNGQSTIDTGARPIKRVATARSEPQPVKIEEQRAPPKVESISINTHFDKDEAPNSKQELLRPIPDGDFEFVPLGEDPHKGVKIGTKLPDLVRK